MALAASKTNSKITWREYLDSQEALKKGGKITDDNRSWWLGKHVFTATSKALFEKESDRRFSFRVYQIASIFNDREPFLYRLKTMDGAKTPRLYYAKELRAASDSTTRFIANILDTKRVNGKKMFRVNFLDHPKTETEWIDASLVDTAFK